MSALSGLENELRTGLEEHPVKLGEVFSYGTAGFRTLYVLRVTPTHQI